MGSRNTRPSVLFISPGPDLATPSSGEGTRLKELSRELSDTWAVYALVPADTESELPWAEEVFAYEQWSLPFLTDLNPSFVRNVARVLSEIEPDVVHTSKGVWMSAVLSRLVDPSTRVIYAAQNVEVVHARDFAADDLPIHKRILGPKLIPFIERLNVRSASHVTTVSEKDATTFRELYGLDTGFVTAIPTGTRIVDTSELESPGVVRQRHGVDDAAVAVFHGTGTHPPNHEAARLIDDELAPSLADRDVDVRFFIAGKGMPEATHPLVSTLGFVEDLDSLLHAADLAVVPIRHGGGTKTKMYDYLSHGLPMVTTEKGVEGIDVEDGVHATVVSEVDGSFVDAVTELVTDVEKRNTMREAVHEFASKRNWAASGNRLKRAYCSLSHR